MKIKMRTVMQCKECGYRYQAPPWEPTFIAKQVANGSHPDYHEAMAKPENHPLVAEWREWERERIIAIIENQLIDSDGYCRGDTLIELIKESNAS